MKSKDAELINDVRRLCRRTQEFYEDLAGKIENQQARNVFKRLAIHRGEIAHALASEPSEKSENYCFAQQTAHTKKGVESVENFSVNQFSDSRFLKDLVAREKHEVNQLRAEVKKIQNYALRCRLSSFVATLQMDFDQLQSLSRIQSNSSKGDDHERFTNDG